MEKLSNEEQNSMVNTNTMLLSFEGWIKYIEGFSRGLQTTKTVDAGMVFDCVGEIMEYMKQLKGQICELLIHCEHELESVETCDIRLQELQDENSKLLEENQNLSTKLDSLKERLEQLTEENTKLKQAATILKEQLDGKM